MPQNVVQINKFAKFKVRNQSEMWNNSKLCQLVSIFPPTVAREDFGIKAQLRFQCSGGIRLTKSISPKLTKSISQSFPEYFPPIDHKQQHLPGPTKRLCPRKWNQMLRWIFLFHVNAVLFQVKQNTKYNHKIHVKMLILKQ